MTHRVKFVAVFILLLCSSGLLYGRSACLLHLSVLISARQRLLDISQGLSRLVNTLALALKVAVRIVVSVQHFEHLVG